MQKSWSKDGSITRSRIGPGAGGGLGVYLAISLVGKGGREIVEQGSCVLGRLGDDSHDFEPGGGIQVAASQGHQLHQRCHTHRCQALMWPPAVQPLMSQHCMFPDTDEVQC